MTFLSSFDIRYSELEDLSALEEWFLEPGACNDYPFSFEERGDALKNWIGFSRFKASLTGTLENKPCAVATLFLMPYKKVMHHCGFYIMVDPAHRRKGIGISMLRNIFNLAKTRFSLEAVHAEIFESSPLLPLLEKLDFQVFARQDNYMKIEGVPRARILVEHFFNG
jgi:RimJ/RimL family protein N-acetyltransferase